MGDEQIQMLINEGSTFPDQNQFDYNGKIGVGSNMIRVIKKEDKHFCVEKGCIYSLLIKATNMKSIAIKPEVVSDGRVYDLNGELLFYDELALNQTKTYEINFDFPPESLNFDVLFSLEPVENNPDFYINLERKKKNYEDSEFQGTADGIEQILVTQE